MRRVDKRRDRGGGGSFAAQTTTPIDIVSRGDIIEVIDQRPDRPLPRAPRSRPPVVLGTSFAMPSPSRLETNESAAITVVRFKDQKIIDPETIQELGQELFDLIDKDQRQKIILNFSLVEFLSSAALGKLITFEKKAKRAGAQLILTDISPEIFPVFAITGLDKLFKIKDREADALAVL
jgi:anti-sigma B factor antagonist